MTPRPNRPMLAALALALAAALPSAQDVSPAQSLSHKSLDAVAWVQSAAEWDALTRQAFTAASASLHEALDDTSITAAVEQADGYESLPPAVILDVDETVLDNSFYQARLIRDGGKYGSATWNTWCEEVVAPAVPGALEFCREAHELGVTVLYVTNRRDNLREVTRQNLERLGFPLVDGAVLTRGGDSDKTPRRTAIAEDHRIVLLIGDNLGDFAGVFRDKTPDERNALVTKYGDLWGRRWIVLPNPMYGDWMGAIMGYDFGHSPMTEMKRMRGVLRPDSTLELPAPVSKSLGFVDSAPVPAAPVALPATPPPPATRAVVEHHAKLSSGPMLGYATATEATVWVQTRGAADVQLVYRPLTSDGVARLTRPMLTSDDGDHIATFTLRDLTPDTDHEVQLFLDGERVALPHPITVTTQPLWLWHGDPHAPPDFTFAFGSCAYINDAPFDRPGQSYGGGYEIFDTIAASDPAFMLWVGDNIYFRDADYMSESGMRRRYRVDRSTPELQRLLGATHHYAVWDDHDYGPNDSDRTFRFRDESAEMFADYWPSAPIGDGVRGVNQRFSWADCEFFLLDDRTWRSPNDAPAGPNKRMLGAEQMQWLKDSLVSSRATFKFIVNGNQVTNPIAPYEALRRFPDEQQELFDFLAAQKINGVMFLSGDRHHSELLRIEHGGSYPWYEFTSSPLTSGVHSSSSESDNPARVDGTLVNDRRSFGRVSVHGAFGKRVVTLSAVDATGSQVWSISVPQSSLRVSP